MKFDSRSNFLALLFGPFYYLFKGMFIKGILLLLIPIVALYYDIGLVCILPFIFVFCSYNADLDYFSKKVLDDVRVHNNPHTLVPFFDKKFATKMLKRPLVGIYFRKILMIFVRSQRDSFFLRPKKVRRRALQTTKSELTLIAAAAIMGLSKSLKAGYSTPAATGMPSTL